MRVRLLAAAIAGFVGACDSGSDGGATGPDSGGGKADDASTDFIAGRLTYDRVPATAAGLDYAATEAWPIRGARVGLLSEAGDLLAETSTDSDGRFGFDQPAAPRVQIQVLAETLDPPIDVEDNTRDDAVYVETSDVYDATEPTTIDLHAASGWDGERYAERRAAAPFAILDTAYEMATALTDAGAGEFPLLRINWSPDNRPGFGDVTKGEIGTSHFKSSEGELYILGLEDVDTDEYDAHIIGHEWGHYFEHAIGRSDNIGGTRGFGAVLDPRVAFSEGLANALSALVLDGTELYDTHGQGQAQSLAKYAEDNEASDPEPGWFSERSVMKILYDLGDDAAEPWDDVAIGLDGVYEVLAGPNHSTEALSTVFSFVDGLKQAGLADEVAIDALCDKHSIAPITDALGTGATNDGGVASNLPVYHDLAAGTPVTIGLVGAADTAKNRNLRRANRFLRFDGTGGRVTVSTACNVDVDLFVLQYGDEIGRSETKSGDEWVMVSTDPDTQYVAVVQGWHGEPIPYDCGVELRDDG